MKDLPSIKVVIKTLNSIKSYLLKIQIEREAFDSSSQKLVSYSLPIFLAIFNCSYTFQAEIFQNTGFDIIFKSFLYTSPDQFSIASGHINYFLLLAYALVILPIFLIIIQLYYKITKNVFSGWVTYTINVSFLIVFRVFQMPISNILLRSIKLSLFTSNSSVSIPLGCTSIFFFILYLLETYSFLIIFKINSLKTRQNHLFACSSLLGDFTLTLNCFLVTVSNVMLDSKEVWQNFLRFVLHAIMIHTILMKQPYYDTKANIIIIYSYIFSLINSAGYLVAYNIGSVNISLYCMLFICLPVMLIATVVFYKRKKGIEEQVKKEINFEWQIHSATIQFVVEFELRKKGLNCGELDELVEQTCENFEKFLDETVKIKAGKLTVNRSLLFIYLNRPEKAYYYSFFYSLDKESFFNSIQMEKIELIVSDYKILQEFYSKYFRLSAKSKKYDLSVTLNLYRICSELYKSYPCMIKIEKKLGILMQRFDKCLKFYSALMKDYQSQENLELYGSFLVNILNDAKGKKYLTLAKNIDPELYNENKGFWLLNKQTGFCVFSAGKNDYGKIIDVNQQLYDILHLNKESASENIFDCIYGPLKKVAHELLENKLSKQSEFELIQDCLKCPVDYENFFIDIELQLMPISWKSSKHLLLAIRPITEILIIIDQSLNILNVSRNFITKVLGTNNKSSSNFLLNRKITYFLPNFLKVYKENSIFLYEIWNVPDKMEISSKTFKFKHNHFIFLSVSNFSKSIFRQNSMTESLKRKHSLTIIQIAESHNFSNKKTKKKLAQFTQHESTIESKKYEYEPDSFDMTKRAKKNNIRAFSSFSKKENWIKVTLVGLFIISVISTIGALVFLMAYIGSFEDSNVIEDYSDMLSKVFKVTIDARYYQLSYSGYFPESHSQVIKAYLNNSIQELSDLLDSVKDESIIQGNQYFYKDLVELVNVKEDSVNIKKTNMQDAIRQFISIAKVLNSSSTWQNEAFRFVYINGHSFIIDRFFESIHLAAEDFSHKQLTTEGYLLMIFFIPQVFILLFTIFTIIPQLKNIGRSYKEILREISRLKIDQLKKISDVAVKRMKAYHQMNYEVKNTDRNRKPEIKKKWKVNSLILVCLLILYFIIVNVCLTLPASKLNKTLNTYTGESLIVLSNYVYISFFWAIEHFLLYDPRHSYNTIAPNFLRDGDIQDKVYKADEKILNIINELRININDPSSKAFLLELGCEDLTQCTNKLPVGLYFQLLELINTHDYSLMLKAVLPFRAYSHTYDKVFNLTENISAFRKICRNYTKHVLDNWNYIGIGVAINLIFGGCLVLVYCFRIKRTMEKTKRFVTFRVFLAQEAKEVENID